MKNPANDARAIAGAEAALGLIRQDRAAIREWQSDEGNAPTGYLGLDQFEQVVANGQAAQRDADSIPPPWGHILAVARAH